MPTTARLKILWLSHLVPYPPKGGVLIRSYHLITQLAKRHDVDLVAFNQKKLISPYFPSIQAGLAAAESHLGAYLPNQWVEEIPAERSSRGKQLLALKSIFTRDPYTINWLKSDAASAHIQRLIKANGYDAIHFDTISLAPYFSSEIRCPTILDHHNIESHMMFRRAKKERNPLKKIYFLYEAIRIERYERRYLSQFSLHIVCSNDDRDRLLKTAPNLRVEVVPNGMNISDSPPARTPHLPTKLLFIGGLDWYPNRDAVHFLLERIWPLLKLAGLNCELDIIGKNPSTKMLAVAKTDPKVRIHGYVDDISSFYENCSAYVCPIRDGGGTKLKIIDAMAHATPVVAHPLACEGIDITDGTNVLLAEEPEDFARQIISIAHNPQLGKDIGDGGYRLAKSNYDFKTIGAKFSSSVIDICRQYRDEKNE